MKIDENLKKAVADENKKTTLKKAELLKVDLGGSIHLEKEGGAYYAIFNVKGKEPFFIELSLLDKIITNYVELAKAQGDYKK